MRVGDAVVRPTLAVERCAVTTRDPETGRRDLDTLHLIRGYRRAARRGRDPVRDARRGRGGGPRARRRPGRAALSSSGVSAVYVVDAVRSPIGRRNGSLSGIRGDELAGHVLNALVERVGVEPAEVEDVQLGCVTQVGEQGWNIGRMAPLVAGWPETVCGSTVDRQCGSSMQACFNAAAAIGAGHLDLVVAAGVEMMSRVPMGSNGGDLSDVAARALADRAAGDLRRGDRRRVGPVARAARRVLARVAPAGDPRAPTRAGSTGELVPVELEGGGLCCASDETPRRDTSLEALAALKPAFLPDGRVTAGSSSQICDGAAAVLLASEAAVSRLGLEPRARFVSFGLAGVDPHRMLHGNPQAFGARARARRPGLGRRRRGRGQRGLRLRRAPVHGRHGPRRSGTEDVNPNGGGISLGHPLGATGSRITATLVSSSSAATAATASRRCASASARRSRPSSNALTYWLSCAAAARSRSTGDPRRRDRRARLVEAALRRARRARDPRTRPCGRRSTASSRSRRARARPGARALVVAVPDPAARRRRRPARRAAGRGGRDLPAEHLAALAHPARPRALRGRAGARRGGGVNEEARALVRRGYDAIGRALPRLGRDRRVSGRRATSTGSTRRCRTARAGARPRLRPRRPGRPARPAPPAHLRRRRALAQLELARAAVPAPRSSRPT